METDKQIFTCKCESMEHQVVFNYDDEDNQLYMHVYLADYKNFWQRVVAGIGYIFGYKCKYGHFDCVILKDGDVPKIKEILDKIKPE